MRIFRACFMLCAIGAGHSFGEPLRINTEQTPPSSMLVEGIVLGRETEKIRGLMARTATPYTIDLLPWKRAYTNALLHSDTCTYSTTRTPEREALFKWVGPTDVAEWQLWGRVGKRFNLRNLEDARNFRIGTSNGDARDVYLRSRGFKVEAVSDDMLNFKKLMLDRIDLWAVSVRTGTTGPRVGMWQEKVVPRLVFHRAHVYLACNTAVPTELIDRLNATLDEMRRDGTFERIERKYENWSAP